MIRHKLYAGFVITLFMAPNLLAVALPFENWPFTSAPMFAHYVGPGANRYRFRFMAEYSRKRKSPKEIRAKDLGLREIKLMRHFFGKVYGSTDARAPWGHHPQDTSEAFEGRLGRFFKGLVTQMQENAETKSHLKNLKAIRLEVARLGQKNQMKQIHVVGRYFLDRDVFQHTWLEEGTDA